MKQPSFPGLPIRLCCAFLLVVTLWPTSSSGQATDLRDPRQALTQYKIDGWQTEQGLPLNTVQSLLQTRDGYLWVGTGGGLARFDGVRFTTFEPSRVPELVSLPIFGLMEDSKGALWIGHSAGAVVYRNGAFERAFGREVTDRRVWSFAEASDGTLWIGTESGLVHWDGGVKRIYRTEDGLPTNRLRSIAFDRDGTLWIGTTGGGLVSMRGDRFEVMDPTTGFPHAEVRWVLPDPEGGVWAATAGSGLVRVQGGQLRTYTVADGLPTDQLTALARDAQGSLWIGTWGAGIARMRDGRITSISTEGGLAGGQIWSVHADREGSVWVGTWVGGLNRLRNRDFVVLGAPEGLSGDNVRSVLHAKNGVTWVTTAGGGLNRLENGVITAITTADGLPSDEASCLYEDRDGAIWVGSYTGGAARLEDGKIETWGVDRGLPHVDVRVMYRDRAGTFWAGTVAGLARFNGERFEKVEDPGAPPEGVVAILEDRTGNLWFGTSGEGLVRYRDGVYQTLTRADGLVSNWIMSLHEDDRGSLWIGTNGEGMNRLRDGKMAGIRPADGLWDGVVQVLLEDRSGNLWITCNRGFFRVSLAELDAFAEGTIPRINSTGFGPGDALRSTTFAGAHQPAGAVDAAGHLWLPSYSGLVIVDPAHLPGSGGPPEVHLEEISVNGVEAPPGEEIVLPPGSAPLSIRYTAATLINADRVRFRYRMEGATGGWVDAGRSREAFFPALPHGKYVFHVAASADGQTWGEADTPLPITVRPYLFQTPWFIALVVLGLLLITAGVLRLRTRNLRLQKAEMERLVAEKTEELKLANDYLARLSYVDALTGLANRRQFDQALDQEWRRAARFGTWLAVVVADVDLFKPYNDTLGHPEGDRCLKAVAEVFRRSGRRAGDVVARYGGEEFALLIPGADPRTAKAFAESLRTACEAQAIPHPASTVAPVVTISLGVATRIPTEESSRMQLMADADAALYRAKREGRNRVVLADAPPSDLEQTPPAGESSGDD
ncbi:MAG: two-component regulator propeller domain-containing protein [Thermoanaerobaculia bacterium]